MFVSQHHQPDLPCARKTRLRIAQISSERRDSRTLPKRLSQSVLAASPDTRLPTRRVRRQGLRILVRWEKRADNASRDRSTATGLTTCPTQWRHRGRTFLWPSVTHPRPRSAASARKGTTCPGGQPRAPDQRGGREPGAFASLCRFNPSCPRAAGVSASAAEHPNSWHRWFTSLEAGRSARLAACSAPAS